MTRLLVLTLALALLVGGIWLATRRDGALGGPSREHPLAPGEALERAELVAPAALDVAIAQRVQAPEAPVPVPVPVPDPPPEAARPQADVVMPRSFLAGRVLRPDRSPAVEIEVAAESSWSRSEIGPLGRARSGGDGTFQLDCLGTGPFRVRATADRGLEAVLDQVEGGRTDLELVIAEREVPARPREAIVRGRVVDPRGEPVAKASIESNVPGWCETDREGRFVLRLPARTGVEVWAGAAGYAASERVSLSLVPDETVEVLLRLLDTARVTGEVRGLGGRPLAATEVSAYRRPSAGTRWSQAIDGLASSAWTDTNGRFELAVFPGRVQLEVKPSSNEIEAIQRGRDTERPAGTSRERTVTVGPGESAHVVFALDGEPVRLHGRIELGGRAPKYAVVQAYGLSIEPWPRATYTAGQYEMLLPSPGAYTLYVKADGMSCQLPVDVPEAAEHRFDVSLPLERITGVVGDDAGSPLAGITVDASSWQEQIFRCSDRAITDERGAYTLELPPGTYRINPREDFEKERSFFESEDAIVLLRAGAPLTGVNFELRTANALEGFVRFPDGSPAAGAGISVVSARGGRQTRQTERARADGSFRVQSLAAGEHLVRGGFAESEEGPYFLSRESLAVEVRAGVPSSIALELVPATRLRVHLTDASGAALDARVEVLDSRGHAGALRKKEDGLPIESGVPVWHEIVLVAPGPFTLRADHARGLFERAFSLAGAGPLVELEFRVE